ncbi:MAG: winged helix-turn-helix domain-containing protein, partial [bacterium]|nr:winged helix-turn-helix domain-containing protein [bacterium]
MIYAFGDYELDTYNYELRLEGAPLRIEPKVFDLLNYLIQHHDHLVSKETLHDHLWPDLFVSESALTYCVTAARKAVGDNGRTQEVIKTLYGRGYRFIATVKERDSAVDAPSSSDLPVREGLLPDQVDSLTPPSSVQTERTVTASPEEIIDSGQVPHEQGFLAAERRQLTVMWCRAVVTDLLSEQLDPEELYELIQDTHKVCVGVIRRFEGHIAQRFGDGLMVYFGYPRAHEDDAYRAVCTGLEIVAEMGRLNESLERQRDVKLTMRVGIHTSMVVMEAVDSGEEREQLVSGDTPHVVAQLPGLAAPNTVVISSATLRLVEGHFDYQSLGDHFLEDLAQPLAIYQVLQERDTPPHMTATAAGSMPFVGREQEVGLLQERWEQVKDGMGQVVSLSGEAGIGKSRLVQ